MAVVTKRKILTQEQQIASAYRRYLKMGGSREPKKVRHAAFDRIADKYLLDKIEVRK